MRFALTILISLSVISCKQILNIRSIYEVNDLRNDTPTGDEKYIKVHFKDGRLAILRKWEVNPETEALSGTGFIYARKDRKRINPQAQAWQFAFDDCVLIETNAYEGYGNAGAIMSFAVTPVSMLCLLDPKSCFGSCPTFYQYQEDSLIIRAEGFSSSITKSMEAVDVDYLSTYQSQKDLKIELKNEAWETHYIRRAEVLAIPTLGNEEIHFDGNRFHSISNLSKIRGASADQLVPLLKDRDRREYLAKSDSIDLSTKETLILEFDAHDASSTGVLITQRQSFMTTFLFYQSMAYMGSGLGELIAAYENASPIIRNAQKNMYDILGGVDVFIMIKGGWKKIGTLEEQGPIVSDTHLLPVGGSGTFNKVKLVMTKGLWRIDQVALGTINEAPDPVVIKPKALIGKGGKEDALLTQLNDDDGVLVNEPGASYTLVYDIPQGQQSLFLRSEGYYTEWMRNEWLKEEDPEMVHLIIKKPGKWLKLMAPKYKRVEPEMEALFWASKFGSHAN